MIRVIGKLLGRLRSFVMHNAELMEKGNNLVLAQPTLAADQRILSLSIYIYQMMIQSDDDTINKYSQGHPQSQRSLHRKAD